MTDNKTNRTMAGVAFILAMVVFVFWPISCIIRNEKLHACGPKARTCDVDWIRSIKDQCQAAGIPFFNKQLGSRIRWGSNGGDAGSAMASRSAGGVVHSKGGDPAEWPEDLRVREWPK